jgi:hypothetical protein
VTEITFYRFALFSPFLGPLFGYPIREQPLGILLVGSIVAGGIPYALLLVGILFWMRKRSAESIRRRILLLPILFGLVLGTYASLGYIYDAWVNNASFPHPYGTVMWLTNWGIIIWYVWVGVVLLVRSLFWRLGWLHS